MSDLRPYAPQGAVPLTAGARFIRGFKRIGIAFGALVLVGGLVTTSFIAMENQKNEQRKFEQAKCIAGLVRDKRPFKMRSYNQSRIDFEDSGCPGYSFHDEALDTIVAYSKGAPPAPFEYAVQPFFIGLAISMACAAASFFLFWLVGWLCAGFTRD